jgi:hypothetical protein
VLLMGRSWCRRPALQAIAGGDPPAGQTRGEDAAVTPWTRSVWAQEAPTPAKSAAGWLLELPVCGLDPPWLRGFPFCLGNGAHALPKHKGAFLVADNDVGPTVAVDIGHGDLGAHA